MPVVAALAAFVERLVFARAWGDAGRVTSIFYYGDAQRFVDYALAILDGRVFDNGIPFHPPGWPLALAAFLKLVGVSSGHTAVPAGLVHGLLAALGAAAVGAACVLTWELAGPVAMVVVALIAPFHFGHLVLASAADSEVLYGLLIVGVPLCARRWLQNDGSTHRWPVLTGALGAAAMLVRAEFLAAMTLLALAAVRGRRGRYAEWALFAAVWGASLAPTTVWHWGSLSAFNRSHVGRVAGPLGTFAPVTSYGPFNFAMANHAEAEGGPNSDHPMLETCAETHDAELAAGRLDLSCPAIYDLYVHGYAIGLSWLTSHPGDALALVGRKLSMTAGVLAHGYFLDNLGAGVAGERRRVDMLDPDGWWLWPIHAALLAVGLYALGRTRHDLLVIAAPLAALLGSVVLFYGYVRLGAAYLPIIWAAQAAGVAMLLERVRGLRDISRNAIIAVCVALVCLAAMDGVRSQSPKRVTLTGPTGPGGRVIEDETLRVVPQP